MEHRTGPASAAGRVPRVLAVADSESFLRWAAATLDGIGADAVAVESRLVVINGPLRPSAAQVRAATATTGSADGCAVVGRQRLRHLVATFRPDVVLVAATGPVAEMVALTVLDAAGAYAPALVTGSPGMALPLVGGGSGGGGGVGWRSRWADAHIVHSPREATALAAEFARHGARPRIVLTRLPFLPATTPAPVRALTSAGPTPTPGVPTATHSTASAGAAITARRRVERVVFTPQAIVPVTRADRTAVLAGLAHLSAQGFEVIVKLRTRPGEQQTHYEALPYDRLWAQEHVRLGYTRSALRFGYGPVTDWLTPDAALLTVSSTSALESMALGRPTIVLADLGVSEALLNTAFEGSGALVRFADVAQVLRAGGPVPSPQWLAANYQHGLPSELGQAVVDLAGMRRPRRVVKPRSRPVHLYSRIKSDHPLVWQPARLVRAGLGRLIPLR